MLTATSNTLLVISGPGMPTYAARGLSQTLDPIGAAGSLARTVNGALINLSPSQMQKYASTISCEDQENPALDGVWPGMTLTVDCVPELGYLTSGGTPHRTVVTGSSRVSGLWTYYRPRLSMRVVNYNVSTNEYGAATSWSLDLEEV
jgi:hypothetical protein